MIIIGNDPIRPHGFCLFLHGKRPVGIAPFLTLADKWSEVGCYRFDADHMVSLVLYWVGAKDASFLADNVRWLQDAESRIHHLVQERLRRMRAVDGNIAVMNRRLAMRGARLHPYQEVGAHALAAASRLLLADEMGLGKTLQVLAAIAPQSPAIVVCPAALKRLVWGRAIEELRPDLCPTYPEELTRWPMTSEVMVVNPERLFRATPPPADLSRLHLVADEAHIFSTINKKAQRYQGYSRLRQHVTESGGSAWEITGSPFLNRPRELAALLEAGGLFKSSFGTFGRFYKAFGGRKNFFGHTEWDGPTPAAHEMLRRVMVRRKREDVLPDLPKKAYASVVMDDSAQAAAALDELSTLIGADFDWSSLPSHPRFTEISHCRALLAQAKIPTALSLATSYVEQDEPLVVFADHVKPVVAMEKLGFSVVIGGMSERARSEAIDRFTSGKVPGIALTIGAGGTGISLVRAAHMLFVSRSYVPQLNAQAEDRITRIGQNRPVTITSIVADHHLDRRLEEINQEKIRMISTAVDGG